MNNKIKGDKKVHLDIIIRGQVKEVEELIDDIKAIYLPYDDGSGIPSVVQLGVRVIVPLEITFPEKDLQKVLGYLCPEKEVWDPRLNKYAWMLRKALGLEKIPDYKKTPIPRRSMPCYEVLGIGIKKDRWLKGIEQL